MKIRSVRPEFFSDVKMAHLSLGARLLYIGLWGYVDDEGRGEYLPKLIEGAIFPHEAVDFGLWWAELEGIGRVVRYEVEGQGYFHVPTFNDHQKPNRSYASKLPAPSEPTAHALRTQVGPTGYAPPVEGEGEGEGAAAYGPDVFHMRRAAAEVKRRQAEGLRVKNAGGLRRSIARDPEFQAESRRLWAHRDCAACKGSGFTEQYAPGAGQVRTACQEVVDG